MARPLRLQFPGARYHIIDRGNYRHPIFGAPGTAAAFEVALTEACLRHRWLCHAHAVMRNHFHLALETPEPNLVDGMHWLLGTFANRFNRFRDERGHLFQGRYTAKLVGDDSHFVRLIHYIHLNPVKAGIVAATHAADFRWGSLRRLMRRPRPPWLTADILLPHLGLADNPAGWSRYVDLLVKLAADPANDSEEFDPLAGNWVIGSPQWQTDLAHRHLVLAGERDIRAADLKRIKAARCQQVLAAALTVAGKTDEDIARDAKGAVWKIEIARQLRVEAQAPHAWIAATLNMGAPASVRVYLARNLTSSGLTPS